MVISINKSISLHDTLLAYVRLYECYKALDKVKQVDYVIAKHNRILKEIYQPTKWYEYLTDDNKKCYSFEGNIVMDAYIRELYLNKKLDKKPYVQPLNW